MEFPIECGGLEINHIPSNGYYVCIPGPKGDRFKSKYIDSDGNVHPTCGSCWHETFRDAARAVVLYLHGEGAARLSDFMEDEHLYKFFRPSAKLITVQFLCDDEEEHKKWLSGWQDSFEYRITDCRDVKIPHDYKWDGSFFNNGE